METLLTRWVEGYVTAWESNLPADIGTLFTEGATYYTEPYAEPWRGRDEIVRQWLAHADAPGDATFTWEPVATTGELSVITGRTAYREPPREYHNLWLIRLDAEGRCAEFTEWYMKAP
ncbi:nuclear transport factor 2 family protein [Longispora sp. K20-0274]|uniref:nuclear transport factor 2 family protein n=1 Tax=Longispora sp. K20-0274 TaxID=3088255 RepID=UPI00399A7D67